ncbi:MAG TPA: tripartite tricarboxylate transporter substrate-binding protein [Burkholderiales bacterium]|nr:tripartite tricarboxylate transporter substrate-binding protein [Burkholderiales bacterium]
MTTLRWVQAGFLCVAITAHAQTSTFPARPVRVIVPGSVGTGMDNMGRSLAQVLTEVYRQQVIIDNRAGAGSLIGTGIVAGAAPDGYTLGVASTSSIVAPLLQAKPPYDPLRDLVQIVLLSSLTSVLVVAPGVPAKNVKEFIAYGKAKPGQLNFASIGAGSAAHLTPEIFNRAAGIDAVHVPFKSVADVFAAMVATQVHYLIWISPASLPMLKEGRLRAMAVTSSKRYAGLPDVPTVAEAGLRNAEVETMIGIVGPVKLPKTMVSRLYGDIASAMRQPAVKEAFERQGGEPAIDVSQAAYAAKWQAEYEVYRRLLPELGLKPQ